MPESRPRIPAEVEREVLYEAGHRCAVCGDACPIERAHIIPWCKSHEHRAEDLICLCANCHQRADTEKWGEKTLRRYKEMPWILRKAAPESCGVAKQLVTFRAELDYSQFDETQQRLLTHALASFLGIHPKEIEIIEIDPGSVIVTVSVPETAAQELLRAIHDRDPLLQKLLTNLADYESDHDAQMRSEQIELLRETLNDARKYFSSRNYERAEPYMREALTLAASLGKIQTQANLCCNLGIIREEFDDLSEAASLHSDALIFDKQTGYQEGQTRHYLNLGRVRYKQGQLEVAAQMLNEALSLARQLGMNQQASDALYWLEQCEAG